MILVCGDAMVDRYTFGEVSRISPEAPVPVVKVGREEEREGGAANVANNIEAMGVPCRRLFSPSAEKIIKNRVIGRNQQVVRVDHDVFQDMISAPAFEEAMYGCGIVVFSDYGKGALKLVRNLIEMAMAAGKTVLVDPKGHDYRRYRGADLVKPNLDEMKELVGGWSDEAELTEKAGRLLEDSEIGALLLTRAEAGMTLYSPPTMHHIPAVAKEIYDVSGAGDAAIAAYAAAIAGGFGRFEAAQFANKAAGIAVTRFGTTVVTKEEVFGV